MGTRKTTRQRAALRLGGIADALFTKGQQRVLGVLFGNPTRSFYANEVIARAGAGTGAVQRELARLEGAGLVTVRRVGNQKHYQANPASPVFNELRALVLKTSGLADVLLESLAALKGQIDAAFVYGSVARGEDIAASDIDLMVVSDGLSYAELYGALEPAAPRLGRPVSPTLYSRDELARRLKSGNAFARQVMEEPKIWLIGDDDALAAR
jgi:predicted nucleotidyltransferase